MVIKELKVKIHLKPGAWRMKLISCLGIIQILTRIPTVWLIVRQYRFDLEK